MDMTGCDESSEEIMKRAWAFVQDSGLEAYVPARTMSDVVGDLERAGYRIHIPRRIKAMDYEIMRLECLKAAYAAGLKGQTAIDEAERMFRFARYGKDPLDNGKVRVVGKDGDLPFKDYVPE